MFGIDKLFTDKLFTDKKSTEKKPNIKITNTKISKSLNIRKSNVNKQNKINNKKTFSSNKNTVLSDKITVSSNKNTVLSNKKTFSSNKNTVLSDKITLIKDPSILRNNTEFPGFEYEGGYGFQTVKIKLNPTSTIRADAGAMNYMGGDISMNTNLLGGGILSGLMGAVSRGFSGSSTFYNIFENKGKDIDVVTFSSPQPGNIGCFYIPSGKSFNFVSDTYICSTSNLKISTNPRFGGLLLGYGLFFVNVESKSGPGLVWCSSFGDVIDIKLKKGESIKIDNGVLLGFDPTIKIKTDKVGGFKSFFLSGEGIISHITNNENDDINIYLQSRSKISYNDYISDIAKKAR